MADKKYKRKLSQDIAELKDIFPYFEPIYSKWKGIKIYKSLLISKEDIEKKLLFTKEEIADEAFKVIIVIDVNKYAQLGTIFYDCNKFIDWSLIPPKDRHCNLSATYPNFGNELCTHIPEKAKDLNNPLLENAKTAYAMFVAYKKFLNGEPFVLKGYSHGKKGVEEYERERREQR